MGSARVGRVLGSRGGVLRKLRAAPRGTQAGDALILRVTFDTDAPLIRQTTHPEGGTTYSFDASSLRLALEVPRLGTHVFTIDDTTPSATTPSLVGITDDLVTAGFVFDSLQFRHNYLSEAGDLLFSIFAVFSSADTSILNGGFLPLSPGPRLLRIRA